MTIELIDLETVRSSKDYLSSRVLERYMSSGIGPILESFAKTSALAVLTGYRGTNMIQLQNGCHRCRALLELGVTEIEIPYQEGTTTLGFPFALKDVPILEQLEYNERRLLDGQDEIPESWF